MLDAGVCGEQDYKRPSRSLQSSGVGSETNRKLNNTAFTTASQWHGHMYYLALEDP